MKYLLATLLVFTLVPGAARADVLTEGWHNVDTCFLIDNLADFPDVNFIISGEYRFPYSYTIEEGGTCGLGGQAKLGAIKKADLARVDHTAEYPELEGGWAASDKNANLLVWSDLALSFDRELPDAQPIVKQRMTVHIDSVDDASVKANYVQTEYENENGKTMILDSAPSDALTIDPSFGEPETSVPVSAAVPVTLVALGLLGLLWAARKWKK